ncbi:hypothetical protein BT69DRAFT_1355560 [Atractiella rhizophila]|nr:hypothetical protein BT69DRAFT_1355560 [Atractiella rhizophila]
MVSMDDPSTTTLDITSSPRVRVPTFRRRGYGGEWRVGDFGYCTELGTFSFSQNVQDFLGPEDERLDFPLREVALNAESPIAKGSFTVTSAAVDAGPPVPGGATFAVNYSSQSQGGALLATTSDALRFAVTHQGIGVDYFKRYFKTVLEEDARAGHCPNGKRELCMIIGVVKTFGWLRAVFGQCGGSFGINVGAHPAGFQVGRDYGAISGVHVQHGPRVQRSGVLGSDVGDQTLFITRIMCKHAGITQLGCLKGGGESGWPSPADPADESMESVFCDGSNETGCDPLSVLLEAMLTLRPAAEFAIASDIDLCTLCEKSNWSLKSGEWNVQKAVKLLQGCGDCINEEAVGLTLRFSTHSSESVLEGIDLQTVTHEGGNHLPISFTNVKQPDDAEEPSVVGEYGDNQGMTEGGAALSFAGDCEDNAFLSTVVLGGRHDKASMPRDTPQFHGDSQLLESENESIRLHELPTASDIGDDLLQSSLLLKFLM